MSTASGPSVILNEPERPQGAKGEVKNPSPRPDGRAVGQARYLRPDRGVDTAFRESVTGRVNVFVGALRLRLSVPESSSLKDKRQATRSILARLRNEFHVAAAEVGDLDSWTVAELGVACVANDARHVDEVLAKAVSFVERYWPDYPLLDVETEVNPAF